MCTFVYTHVHIYVNVCIYTPIFVYVNVAGLIVSLVSLCY